MQKNLNELKKKDKNEKPVKEELPKINQDETQKSIALKSLYKKALDKWGYSLQMVVLMEEASELIQAASKIIRNSNDALAWTRFAEEIADVEIMIEQFKAGVTWHDLEYQIQTIKETKLAKLARMVL